MYDLLISGGTIVDGTGSTGYTGDVAIKDGTVVAIGDAVDAASESARTIDATGKVVCPGFVDIHTHYDAQVLWDRMLTVSPWHGVTTVVMGNCGFGVAPTRPAHRDLIVRTLEKVEGMSAAALRTGLGDEWPFETFPDYLDAVEAHQPAINVAALIGHTPTRLYVMGEESTERAATPDEIATMRRIVAEAIDAGAIGFATSKSSTHVGYEGRPVPSRSAELDEITALAGALGDAGTGVIQATMGAGFAFDEFAAITEATGRTISWTALLAGAGGPGIWEMLLDESAKLLDRGLPVHPQVSCRPLNFEFTMAEPFTFESMRIFKPVSAAPDIETKMQIYRDDEFRTAFRDRLNSGKAGVLGGSWERTVVSWFPPDPALQERNVAELAAARDADPTDLVLDLALESGLEARFRMAVLNYDEDDVEVLLKDPHTMLGLSDAGAHASQLCDSCFSTHLLSRWVRERKALTLEEAVRKLTSEPAAVFGITDRGTLAVGRPADVVVFDPDEVGCSELRRVHDQPAGADRLIADASGIDAVIVNGVAIRENGADVVGASDALPGRLLRNGAAS
ncbi:MAG: D-aminoacylase [Actinobacteria bacterium]|nr:D-aminoacylase [Actinomycetota bacterium]